MKPGALQRYFVEKLIGNYNEREIRNIFFQVIEEYFGIDRVHFFLEKDREFTDSEMRKVRAVIKQLQTYKPLQYIFKKSEFCGLVFEVNPSVLIPRPETEELVDLIIQRNTSSKDKIFNILDIGTGSGCLAVSLAHLFPGSRVQACDISKDALKLAIKNAQTNKVNVDFFELNILENNLPESISSLDFVVSNPPYVTEADKGQMKPNVLLYEPHLALFVPDNDALIFYRMIAEKLYSKLKRGGKLFFEINEMYGQETVQLLEQLNYSQIMLWNDIHGKDRFVEAVKE